VQTPASHSHRALWIAIGVLALVSLGHGMVLFFYGGFDGSSPGASNTNPTAIRQEVDISDRDIAFDQRRLDEIQQGQATWLEAFFRESAVPVDQADVARGAIVRYMMSINEVRVMEARGLHPGDKSYRFFNVERSRLIRTLETAIGEEAAAHLDRVLQENGVQWPPAGAGAGG